MFTNDSSATINNCNHIFLPLPNHSIHRKMKPQPLIAMNEALFLRNPESSELGRKIVKYSIELIHRHGFEAFTFRKLAEHIGTTEAGVYRYFENKHKLLVYLTAWYWGWLEFQIIFETNNITDPYLKLEKVIALLAAPVQDDEHTLHVNESLLHQIIIEDGSKAYLTKHVEDDNKQKLFQPYKNLCASIGLMINECDPNYPYPRSLASTIVEMAHFQNYFKNHLPSLTDFGQTKNEHAVIDFLKDLVFSAVGKGKAEIK